MTPSDLDLIDAYFNNRLSENDFERLCDLLEHNAAARSYLRSYATVDFGVRALAYSQHALQEPRPWQDVEINLSKDRQGFSPSDNQPRQIRRALPFFHTKMLIAAAVAFVGIFVFFTLVDLIFTKAHADIATVVYISDDAQLPAPLERGNRISLVPIYLKTGTLNMRFDSGADITLFGPARFIPIDKHGGKLEYGTVIGKAPEDHKGLHVVGPNFVVTDLGTEFILKVDQIKGSELLVTNGSVALKPQRGQQVIAKQDEGYHIDSNEKISVLNKEQVEEVFGKILLTRQGVPGILTPETVAFLSFSGAKPDEWRDIAAGIPIPKSESFDQETGAVIINGSEILSIGNRKDLMIDSPMTIEAKIFIEQPGDEVRFFGVQNRIPENRAGWAVSLKEQSSGLFSPAFVHHRVKRYEFPTIGLPIGRWAHFMFTVDDTKVRLYVDGIIQGELQREGAMFKDGTANAMIGGGRKNNAFKGKVAYIAIHRRILTGQDIQSRNMSGGRP